MATIEQQVVQHWTHGSLEEAIRAVFTRDTIAPSPPGAPAVGNRTRTGVAIAWTASTDNIGVAGYGYPVEAQPPGTAVTERIGAAVSGAATTGLLGGVPLLGGEDAGVAQQLEPLADDVGETIDTLEAARHARRQGSQVIAVTNTVGSSLAREADGVLQPSVGCRSQKLAPATAHVQDRRGRHGPLAELHSHHDASADVGAAERSHRARSCSD